MSHSDKVVRVPRLRSGISRSFRRLLGNTRELWIYASALSVLFSGLRDAHSQDLVVGTNTPSNTRDVFSGTNRFANTYIGLTATATNNTLTVRNLGTLLTNSGDLYVGSFGSANRLIISNGARAQNNEGRIGSASGSSNNLALVTGAGSLWTSIVLDVGRSGSVNSLTLTNGGRVASGTGSIGSLSTASNNIALVTGAGSSWSNSANFFIGNEGSINRLVVSNGGIVRNADGVVGSSAGSSNNVALVTGAGSLWTNSGDVRVGSSGNGNQLVVSNGAAVRGRAADIGAFSTASNNAVLVIGAGSLWSNSSTVTVGRQGLNNSLTVVAGGRVAASGILLADSNGSSGTLNIGRFGANDAAGTVVTPTIAFGRGTGALNFNQGDAVVMTSVISGNGTLNKLGAGTTTLAALNTYGGVTTVGRGVLRVTNLADAGVSSAIGTNASIVLSNGGILDYAGTTNSAMNRTINLAGGNGGIGVSNSAVSLTLSGVISNTGNLIKSGLGRLILAAANTFTGTTTVSAGVLRAANNTALGATTAGTRVASGAALELSGGITVGAESLDLSGTGIGGGGALRSVSGNNTYQGTITNTVAARINADAGLLTLSGGINANNQLLTLGGAGNMAVSGAITNSTAGLTKDGTGTATLTGVSTYTGATTVGGGTLALSGVGALSALTAINLTGSGAVFDISGITASGSTNGSLAGVAGSRVNLGTKNLNVGGNNTSTTFAGVIGGAGSFTKSGTGTMLLTGQNTYGGVTTVGGGVLRVTNLADAGTSSAIGTNATIVLSNGGILDYAGTTNSAMNRGIDLAGGNGGVGVSNSAVSLTLGGVISNSGNFVKSGPGRLVLTAANTFTGTTTVTSGTLALSGGGSLSALTAIDLTSSGSVFDISGITASGSTNGSLAGVAGSRVNLGTKNLNVGGNNTSTTFAGVIGGSGSLTKTGAGTMALTGVNAYTGGTLVNGGTLSLNATNTLADAGTVTVTGVGSVLTNSTNFFVGNASTGNRLIVTNGGAVRNKQGVIGNQAASGNNVATVTGEGSLWTNGSDLFVGNAGSGNQLIVGDGGRVRSRDGIIGAQTTAGNNVATVTDAGSLWTNAGDVYVGRSGSGNRLVVSNGATVHNDFGFIGNASTANNNIATVTGADSLWYNDSLLSVGRSGSGNQLLVTEGGTVRSSFGSVGSATGANNNTATVDGSGSVWTNDGEFSVGNFGSGNRLVVSNGASVLIAAGRSGSIGEQSVATNNVATVTGAGSLWEISDFKIGNSGSGNRLVVSNGGTVRSSFGAIGSASAASNNTVLVTGAGSLWTNNDTFRVGNSGSGNRLVISNGGTVASGSDFGNFIGHNSASSDNAVLVIGAGSSWSNSSTVTVGRQGLNNSLTVVAGGTVTALGILLADSNGSSGTLNIGRFGANDAAGTVVTPTIAFGRGTGVLNFNQGDAVVMTSVISGNGTLNQLGAGTTTLAALNTYGGVTTVGRGVLRVTNLADAGVSSAIGTNGSIVLSNGGILDYAGTTNSAMNRTINLAGGNGGIGVSNSAVSLTLSGVISNTGNLIKSGLGRLILAAANTFTGTTTVSAGVLRAANNTALGATTAGTRVASGAALELAGGITVGAESLDLSGTGIGGGGALRSVSGNNIYQGTITNTAAARINADAGLLTLSGAINANNQLLTLGGAGNMAVSGPITNSTAGLTKDGTGTATLTGASTYMGVTTVSAGVLRAANNTALGSTAAGTRVASGAALELAGGITVGAESLDLSSTGVGGGGALRSVSGNNTYQGTITNTAAARINADAGLLTLSGAINANNQLLTLGGAGNMAVSGAITNSTAGLTKDGTGTATLTGVSTYTGATTVDGGTLALSGGGRLSAVTAINLTGSGSVFDITGITASGSTNGSLAGVAGSRVNLGTKNLNVGGNNTSTTFAGVVGGAGSLTKTGSGTMELTGVNTYTGGTLVNGGTLSLNATNTLADAGTVTVTGVGSALINSTNFFVGNVSTGNRLVVTNGGIVDNLNGVLGSQSTSSNNIVTVAGVGSLWTNSNGVIVGGSGSGNELVVTNGGLVRNRIGVVGNQSTSSNNIVTVTGAGSFWNNSARLTVGGEGSGNRLVVSNRGGVQSSQNSFFNTLIGPSGVIGANSTSSNNIATVTGAGSFWNNVGNLTVGGEGSGNQLVVSNGGRAFSREDDPALSAGVIGATSTASNNIATVIGAGSLWDNSGSLTVGSEGSGNQLVIGNGAEVRSSGPDFVDSAFGDLVRGAGRIGGASTASNNTATVSGPGSLWTNDGWLLVGISGSGNQLVVSNSGTVRSTKGTIGDDSGASNNIATVTGAGSLWSNLGGLTVGNFGSSNQLVVSNGGVVSSVGGVVGASGRDNIATVTGAGSLWTSAVGLTVGNRGSGHQMVVSNGGRVLNAGGNRAYIGEQSTASNNIVTVTGAGSLWSNGTFVDLSVGRGGSGNQLVVSNGGTVLNSEGLIGHSLQSGSNRAVVTGAGSQWGNTNTLYVGREGSGNELVVSNGGTVRSSFGVIGLSNTSGNNVAMIIGAASLWSNSASVYVGDAGSGNQLIVSNGGTVHSFSGRVGVDSTSSNNAVLVTGAGSLWSNSFTLTVGRQGFNNSLTVVAGGRVAASGIVLADSNGSSGTLNFGRLGANDAGGAVIAPTIAFGAGSGAVNFNQSDTLTMTSVISGNGTLNQLGVGTTTLTGANSFTGTTTVSAGILRAANNAALGSTAAGTRVASGAALELAGGIAVGAESLDLSGAGISGGGALRSVSGNSIYQGTITNTAAARINADAGLLTLSGAINANNQLLTLGGAGNMAVSGPITNSTAGLTKDGTGTATLTGVSTYTGATTVGGGTLALSGGGSLSAVTAINLTGSGAVFDISGITASGSTNGSLAGVAGSRVNLGTKNLNVGGNNTSTTFAGVIGGSGSFTKSGTGATTLAASNTYGGVTILSAGVLRAANNAALGSTAAGTRVASGAALELAGGITVGAESLDLSGTGIGGGGALRSVSGNNIYQGTITNTAAARINADVGLLTLSGAINANNQLLTLGGAGNMAVSGPITNSTAGLTKDGTGTATLTGVSTYTGATTVGGGTLALSGGGRLSAVTAINLTGSGAVFDISGITASGSTNGSLAGVAGSRVNLGTKNLNVGGNNTSTTFAGVIGGAGSFTKSGTGTMLLTGQNTYGGVTTVGGGVLRVTNLADAGTSSAIGTNATIVLSNGGILDYAGTINSAMNRGIDLAGGNGGVGVSNSAVSLTLGGVISNSGNFVKSGPGRLVLTAANTFTGTTTVTSGTLALSGGGSLSALTAIDLTSSGSVFDISGITASGSTNGSLAGVAGSRVNLGTKNLNVGGNNTSTTFAGVIGGSGSLTKTGAGTMALTGFNTYTGGTLVNGGTLSLNATNTLADAGTVTVTGVGSVLTNSTNFFVGNASTGNRLIVTNGGAVRNIFGFIGNASTSSNNIATVTGAGSVWSNDRILFVGTSGTANRLVVSNGGTVSSSFGVLGNGSTANVATVTGAGSVWTNRGGMIVGHYLCSGNQLVVSNGGTVLSDIGQIGVESTASNNIATVTGAGSLWTNEVALYVGYRGSGNQLVVSNGGTVNSLQGVVGSDSTSSNNAALVSGVGSFWSNSSTVTVGQGGLGNSLTIVAGGRVAASGIVLADSNGSSGTLNIGRLGANDAAGTVIAPTIAFGAGNGTINFNQNNTLTLTSAISGNGTLNQLGAGTTTLTASNAFAGPVAVSGGTLALNSASGSALGGASSISVGNGAALSLAQSGQVNDSAAITLSGGTIRRGSGVSEAFGNLNVTSLSFLDFGTGTAGNLTFGTLQNNETPTTALLGLNNFTPGNSLTFSSTSFTQASINSYFTFGAGFQSFSLSNTGSTFTLTSVASPTIRVAGARFAAFSTTEGTPSETQTVHVSGSELEGDLIVTASSGNEVSYDGVNFAPVVALEPLGGSVGITTIRVRLSGESTGPVDGEVTFASAGATPQTRAVSGEVVASAYETWVRDYGLDPAATTGATAGARTADPDGDGFENFREFCFGGDPTAVDDPSVAIDVIGNGLLLTWIQRDNDVNYVVESMTGQNEQFTADGNVTVVNGPSLPALSAGYSRKQATVQTIGSKFFRVQAYETEQLAP